MPRSFSSLSLTELTYYFNFLDMKKNFPDATAEEKDLISAIADYIRIIRNDLPKITSKEEKKLSIEKLESYSDQIEKSLRVFESEKKHCTNEKGEMSDITKEVYILLTLINHGVQFYLNKVNNDEAIITEDTEKERAKLAEVIEHECKFQLSPKLTIPREANRNKTIEQLLQTFAETDKYYPTNPDTDRETKNVIRNISAILSPYNMIFDRTVRREKEISVNDLVECRNFVNALKKNYASATDMGKSKEAKKVYKDAKNALELIIDGVDYYIDQAKDSDTVKINKESEEKRLEVAKIDNNRQVDHATRRDAAGNLEMLSNFMTESNKSWFTTQSNQFKMLREAVDVLRDEIKNNGISEKNAQKIYCMMSSVDGCKAEYDKRCHEHIKNNTVRKIRVKLSKLVGEELMLLNNLPEIKEAKKAVDKDTTIRERVEAEINADRTKNVGTKKIVSPEKKKQPKDIIAGIENEAIIGPV